jgi:type IV pilus assembly protein PilV
MHVIEDTIMGPKPYQTGFTLIEVLIAVLVLSLGLLGIAGLQLQGTRHVYDSQLYTVALLQAQDMADRMRANLEGVRAGSYNNLSGTPADPGCIAAGCTTAQLATFDLFRWNTDNTALLPSGAGDIACTDPAGAALAAGTAADIGSRCTITVRWDADRNGATGTNCNPDDTDDLRCLRLSVVP